MKKYKRPASINHFGKTGIIPAALAAFAAAAAPGIASGLGVAAGVAAKGAAAAVGAKAATKLMGDNIIGYRKQPALIPIR